MSEKQKKGLDHNDTDVVAMQLRSIAHSKPASAENDNQLIMSLQKMVQDRQREL